LLARPLLVVYALAPVDQSVHHDRTRAGDKTAELISHKGATREALVEAWNVEMYADQRVPINVLMAHSDCDGEIPADMCSPIADALEALLGRYMPPRALYDEPRPATERFIAGLRRAAAKGEPVAFR
jgi:hypothetical protein